MNFLTEFKKSFWNYSIPVRRYFSSPQRLQSDNPEEKHDIVGDLVTKPVACACLPIAKQIAVIEPKIQLSLPLIGDVFIGIQHTPIINQVNFVLHNQLEAIKLQGLKQDLTSTQGDSIWTCSPVPIPLVCLSESQSCYLEVEIEMDDHYSLQMANQEEIKAYYGYFQKPIPFQMTQQAIYNLPLHNESSQIQIICGLWTVKETK